MKDNIKKAFQNADTIPDSKKDIDSNNDNMFAGGDDKFMVTKKEKAKNEKKMVPFYLDGSLVKRLDMVCKKTGRSRNELVVKMLEFALSKIEIEG